MANIARYYIKDAEEIFPLARHIAKDLPNSLDVMIGIYELLLNAVEHGNLGMDRDTKSTLLRNGSFGKELNQRLALPENKEKYIEIKCERDGCFIRLSIRDQGKGFDWHQRMNIPTDHRSLHGRGLLIAKQCGFDAIAFNELGNAVTCFASNKTEPAPNACNYAANAPACEKIQCARRPSLIS
ncbi:hypothetical protein GC177_02555 [bacterium]|nr:hypothetical protein [bacterium]